MIFFRRTIKKVTVLLLFFILWELLPGSGIISKVYLAPPSEVFVTLVRLLLSGELWLLNKYKESKTIEKRDWRTYEQRLMNRVKGAIHNLEPLIDEATNIEIHRGPGRPPEFTLKQSVLILLTKELIGKSNRNMASILNLDFRRTKVVWLESSTKKR